MKKVKSARIEYENGNTYIYEHGETTIYFPNGECEVVSTKPLFIKKLEQ